MYVHNNNNTGEVVPQSHRFRETLECRLRPWQDKYHEMGQVCTYREKEGRERALEKTWLTDGGNVADGGNVCMYVCVCK